jgi:hypothetical protein
MKPREYQLNTIVKEMIVRHIGGRDFFNALDSAVRNQMFAERLYQLAIRDDAERYLNEDNYDTHFTIASGKFGLILHNWLRGRYFNECDYDDEPARVLLVPGGLRHGNEEIDLAPFATQIRDEKFIFLDDSMFSGTTRNAIAEAIACYGGELAHSYVVYDGSKKKDSKVTSLYRYYDHVKQI